MKKIIRKTSPLDVPIKETPDITWVEPDLVCNIKFSEITDVEVSATRFSRGCVLIKPRMKYNLKNHRVER